MRNLSETLSRVQMVAIDAKLSPRTRGIFRTDCQRFLEEATPDRFRILPEVDEARHQHPVTLDALDDPITIAGDQEAPIAFV